LAPMVREHTIRRKKTRDPSGGHGDDVSWRATEYCCWHHCVMPPTGHSGSPGPRKGHRRRRTGVFGTRAAARIYIGRTRTPGGRPLTPSGREEYRTMAQSGLCQFIQERMPCRPASITRLVGRRWFENEVWLSGINGLEGISTPKPHPLQMQLARLIMRTLNGEADGNGGGHQLILAALVIRGGEVQSSIRHSREI